MAATNEITELILKKLANKFLEEDLEWRIQKAGSNEKGKMWAKIVPYIKSEAIMQRLDEVVGLGNWQDEYKPSPCGRGYLCGISIKINNEWITKWDGAEISGGMWIDNVKTTLTNSTKRTGVKWGIGRYLRKFEPVYAECYACDGPFDLLDGFNYAEGKIKNSDSVYLYQWKEKPIPLWALPVSKKQIICLVNAMKNANTLEELQTAWLEAYKTASSENNNDFMKLFTNTRNEKKEYFETESKKQIEIMKKNIDKAIEHSVNLVMKATNESTAKGIADSEITRVENNLIGGNLTKAIKAIKKAAKDRINELRNNQ